MSSMNPGWGRRIGVSLVKDSSGEPDDGDWASSPHLDSVERGWRSLEQ